jgi:RNA polymerase sigma-70 factor (ECF subfamily)
MSEADRVGRDRGLRAAVLAGDDRAWQTWYDESFPALDAYVLWRCGGLRDLADDALQETWLTAVRRVRKFNPERSAFSAWLRGIAANVMRNQIRRRAMRRTHSLNGDVPGRDATATRDRGERIAHALAGLSERYEQVLRLKYLEDKSVDAIAREWNESAKAVESLLTRARTAFRDAYDAPE